MSAVRTAVFSSAKKKLSKGEDIGYVGEVTRLIRRSFMTFWKEISFRSYSQSALMKILIPTISMRTMQPAPLQRQLRQRKLAFLSDIEGVYRDADDPSTLISELRVDEAENLISDGTVGGGMIPKLKNCIDAIEHGVNRVHILMEGSRTAYCLRSLQTKVLVLQF